MIQSALKLLQNELQTFINTEDATAVVMDNIGMIGTPLEDSLTNSIVLTLINTEDQKTTNFWLRLKRIFGLGNSSANPPGLLNLYVLFSFNYSATNYPLALKRLDSVIKFFQNKNLFSISSAVPDGTNSINTAVNHDFKMEFCNLNLKETNELWGSLGGRQVPFAFYKLRFVPAS